MQDCETQLYRRQLWELFSFSTDSLRFVGKQIGFSARAFSVLFSVKQGERHFNYAVHRVLHPRVHPIVLITGLQTKHLGRPQHAFWTWLGRGVRWNDPAFCRTVRPKGFSGGGPAHTGREKESMVLFPAI